MCLRAGRRALVPVPVRRAAAFLLARNALLRCRVPRRLPWVLVRAALALVAVPQRRARVHLLAELACLLAGDLLLVLLVGAHRDAPPRVRVPERREPVRKGDVAERADVLVPGRSRVRAWTRALLRVHVPVRLARRAEHAGRAVPVRGLVVYLGAG